MHMRSPSKSKLPQQTQNLIMLLAVHEPIRWTRKPENIQKEYVKTHKTTTFIVYLTTMPVTQTIRCRKMLRREVVVDYLKSIHTVRRKIYLDQTWTLKQNWCPRMILSCFSTCRFLAPLTRKPWWWLQYFPPKGWSTFLYYRLVFSVRSSVGNIICYPSIIQ